MSSAELPVTFSIRSGLEEDGRAVRRLVFDVLNEYDVAADPDDSDADVMTFGAGGDRRAIDLVAEQDGLVVGSVMVREYGNGLGKLSKLFVLPAFRRDGIGRALMVRAMEVARESGYRRLEINTRARYREAVALYEATGWTRGPDREGDGPSRVYLHDLR